MDILIVWPHRASRRRYSQVCKTDDKSPIIVSPPFVSFSSVSCPSPSSSYPVYLHSSALNPPITRWSLLLVSLKSSPRSRACHIPKSQPQALHLQPLWFHLRKDPMRLQSPLGYQKKHCKNASKAGNNQVALEDLQSLTSSPVFRCPISSCGKAFPRKDNLWMHISKMHGILDREE